MREREMIAGFSELKDLLIRTYRIDRPRELVKLHFTENQIEVVMHDNDDHSKAVTLCFDRVTRRPAKVLSGYAFELVRESLRTVSPAKYLNDEFLSCGFFVSR